MKLTKEVKENIDSYFDNITLVELEKKLIDYNIIPKKGLTYNQKIVNEFVKWLKSKRAYSEYIKEFNIQLHSNLDANDVENVKKVLLELASSIYNLMEIFPFHSTKKGYNYWTILYYKWDEYLDEIESKLNNYLLKIVHIPTNEYVEIECKDINLSTRSHASTIEFFKNQNYSELQTKTMSFLKEHNIPVTYVHPYGVYFESANVRVSIEDNLF
jgi:hypothetical protein